MSELMKIADLKPGMVIVRISEQNGPVKIRKSGLVSSEAMVQGLAEMGVQEVEVDLAQTVEIEKSVHHRTQTQALIRGEHDSSINKFDSHLSEQFNRSLFLPTVQGLPSLWKVYTRQVLAFMLVILVGLVIGGAAGSYPVWWSKKTDELVLVVPDVTAVAPPAKEKAVTDDIVASVGVPELSATQTKTKAVTDIADSASAEQQVIKPEPQQEQPVVTAPEPQTSPESEPDYEGEVLNAPPEEDVDVSPELMARFNKAMDELENQPAGEEPTPQVKVTDDLPRVDQLPVRMLTRLPSMAFSAHMYASRPSDRWVRVNGRQLGQGDWIEDEVQIVKIEAQRVILSFEGKEFSMAALTDW